MSKVSVIIPVYGVEKYIERCVRSLFEQTLDDIEFIFVDDCTLDRSIEILESLIEEYRLRIAEKNYSVRIERMLTNSGQAAVRRRGIEIAKGDYIIHCDSDDWVDKDMYFKMYAKTIPNHADMVVCNYCQHNGMEVIGNYRGFICNERVKFITDMLYQKIAWSLCNKLIKRDIYEKIECFPSASMGEDMVISLQAVYFCKTIETVPDVLYYYYVNSDSISRKDTSDAALNRVEQYRQNVDCIHRFYSNSNEYRLYKKAFNWTKYSIKLMCNSKNPRLLALRRTMFPQIEFSVLLDKHVSLRNKLLCIRSSVQMKFYEYITTSDDSKNVNK